MKIDFTKDEIEKLREFIEFGFIDYIRNFEVDNVRYLFSMGSAFDKLEQAEKTLKECTEMCEPETDYRYDTDNVIKSNNNFIQTMKEELGNE